jgi:hypothetical protein
MYDSNKEGYYMFEIDDQKSTLMHRRIQVSDARDSRTLVRPAAARTDVEEEPDADRAIEEFLNDELLQDVEAKKDENPPEKAHKVSPKKKIRKYPPVHFSTPSILLVLACAVIAVFAIVFVVDLNSPDISTRVAAMQNSIDAVYPKYTPRGYTISDITSESGKVVLNFRNTETEEEYSLTEEDPSLQEIKSLDEYVLDKYGSSYAKYTEQNIDVYIGTRGAVWMADGLLYELSIQTGSLTKKQILTIAVSR